MGSPGVRLWHWVMKMSGFIGESRWLLCFKNQQSPFVLPFSPINSVLYAGYGRWVNDENGSERGCRRLIGELGGGGCVGGQAEEAMYTCCPCKGAEQELSVCRSGLQKWAVDGLGSCLKPFKVGFNFNLLTLGFKPNPPKNKIKYKNIKINKNKIKRF